MVEITRRLEIIEHTLHRKVQAPASANVHGYRANGASMRIAQ